MVLNIKRENSREINYIIREVKRIDETAYGSFINQPFLLGACSWMRQTGTVPNAGDRTGSGNGHRCSPN